MHLSAVNAFKSITNLNPPSWTIAGMYIVTSFQDELKWSYAVVVVFNVSHEKLQYMTVLWRDRRWHSWLRHCATSWKIAGSIPDGVIGIFHGHPSDRTRVLGLTQPLTEMSTRNIPWG